MKIIFKKNVMNLKTNKYFPINEEVYLDNARFDKLKESIKKFGKEEEYFEIVKEKKPIKVEKEITINEGYNDDAQIVENI